MADESLSRGLKMELRPSSTTYSVGELPRFDVIVTNVSTGEIQFCTYMLKHRLLISIYSGNIGVYPFGSTPASPLCNSDFRMMAPGEELVTSLDFAAEDEYHFLFRGSLPRVVPKNMAVTHFEPGSYTFSSFIGPSVFLYVADRGTFAHQRIEKVILNDVERSPALTVDTSLTWDGELTAKTRVSFVP